MEASALRMCMPTSSTRSLISCTIFMLSTSTPTPCLSVSVTSDSTDSLVPFSRDSEFLTGLLPRSTTAGSMMLTPELPGTTLCMTSTLNGLLLSSRESLARSLTLSNGSETSSLERDSPPDFSTTRELSLRGTDMEDICLRTTNLKLRERRSSTLSPTLTSSPRLYSAWIPPLKKAELLTESNMKYLLSWLLRSSRWRTSPSLMSLRPPELTSLTSEESGNTTVTTS